MNYFPFHIGDYASATRHLSWEEDCAFRRLLDVYYTTEKALPIELRQVCRLVLATTEGQREAVQTVLEEFFTLTDAGWINKRADAELAAMLSKRAKARDSALIGVEARAKKAESTNAEIRAARLAAARAKATHTPEQWARMVSLCGGACVRCGSTASLQKDHIKPIYQGGSDGIENLQPLCQPCNGAKGPEAVDHRPESVRSAFAAEFRANAELQAANAELPTPTPTPVIKEPIGSVASKLPTCPHADLIELYHDQLPELPTVRLLSEGRKKALTAFWRWILTSRRADGTARAQTADQALTWARDYFARARENDFLMGRTARSGEHSAWQCDIDFLLTEKGKKHVIEKTKEHA